MKPAPPVTARRTPTSVAADPTELRLELDHLRRELDEQVRLNTILAEASEQFVSALAHDLKNPLAAIKINVQGLERNLQRGDGAQPEHLSERLTRIEEAVNQALDQLTAARARVSSSAAPRKVPRPEPLDLVTLLRSLVKRIQGEAGHQRLRLETHCPTLVGLWDEAHLQQAFEHLLDNALKFSGPHGKATVSVRREGEGAAVSVADAGIGIPPRDLAHVCERFYRAENVLGRYKGAGLGLFEAQSVIAGHRGRLTIDSEESRGSTFTVYLPLHVD